MNKRIFLLICAFLLLFSAITAAVASSTLTVQPPTWTLSASGTVCTINRPVIDGGTGVYTLVYQLLNESGTVVYSVKSDDEQVELSCVFNGRLQAALEISDGFESKLFVTEWFEAGTIAPVVSLRMEQSPAPVFLPMLWF